MTTLKAARADLAAAATTAVAGFAGVTVLPYDPPVITGDTVTVSTAAPGAVEWRLFIRIYVPAIQSEEGQDRLDDLMEAVDEGMPSSVARVAWEFAFDESKEAFVMLCTVDYPREDF